MCLHNQTTKDHETLDHETIFLIKNACMIVVQNTSFNMTLILLPSYSVPIVPYSLPCQLYM